MDPKKLLEEVITGNHEEGVIEKAKGEVAEAVAKSFTDKFFNTYERHGVSASNAGSCARKLAYQYHGFEGEPLALRSRISMFLGDVMETAIIALLKSHPANDQTGFQREVEFAGLKGHIDFEDDEFVTDAKCLSKFGFDKEIKSGISNDFGYVTQGAFYSAATGKKFRHLAVNKNNGDIQIVDHDPEGDDQLVREGLHRKRIVEESTPENLPEREHGLLLDKKSGQNYLDIQCVYCPFKSTCWDITSVQQITPAYSRIYAKPRAA